MTCNGVVEPTQWYRYLLAIRSPRPHGGGTSELEQRFRDAGWSTLDFDDGHIGPRRRPRGGYQFVGLDTVRAAFPTAEWLSVAHPVPEVGPVCGFLNFEWWTDDPDVRAFDIETWMHHSCGYLVDLSTTTAFDFIVRRRWPLREALDHHGFDDGDFFLSRRPEYLDQVREILAGALSQVGVAPDFITYDTHHNPVLVDSFDAAAVEGRFVDLWGWNHAAADDPGFRRHVRGDPAADPSDPA